MGNAQSDKNEQHANNIISQIPLVNVFYNIPRTIVYAAKGNDDQVVKSAIKIPGQIAAAGSFFIGGPGAGIAVNAANNVFAAAAGVGYDIAKTAGPGAPASLLTAGNIDTEITVLRSGNGVFRFVMQDDGNIVLYKDTDGQRQAKWKSDTWQPENDRKGPFRLVMQADRNLVAYDRDRNPIWKSDTWAWEDKRNGPFVLIMQDDGNCVMYDKDRGVIWSTNTWDADYAIPE